MRLKVGWMGWPAIVGVIVIHALLISCNDEEQTPVDETVIASSLHFADLIKQWDKEGTLVVNHWIDQSRYHLILENSDTIKVSSAIIKSFQPKPAEWAIAIGLTDGSIAHVPALGNEIKIPVDSILLNPKLYAPLSARVNISLPVKGKFRMNVKGKNGSLSDLGHTFSENAKVHRLSVFGLYPNFENTVELFFTDKDGRERLRKEIKITTAPLPSKMPTIEIDVAKRSSMESGLTLVSYRGMGIPFIPFIMDSFGDVRWYADYASHPELKDLSYECGIEQLHNGNLYFGNARTHKIYEIDFFGDVIMSWNMPGYTFHHNVIEKPNGNFIVTVSKMGSMHLNGKPTINDFVVEINRISGAIVTEWDLRQVLDENRIAWINNLGNATVNWLHNNGIIYDENDNSIVITGRFQGMMKISYNNQLKWIISTHDGWATSRNGTDLNSKLLRPVDQNNQLITKAEVLNGTENHADFEWAWYPHSPMVMSNGNVMVFDNGDNRNYSGADKYSRAVEYKIDETNMTVKQVWQYGKERGIKAYSQIQSDVDYLPEKNNVLVVPGWNVDNNGKFGGKIIEVNYLTKEVVFEARITPPSGQQTLHRAERIHIY